MRWLLALLAACADQAGAHDLVKCAQRDRVSVVPITVDDCELACTTEPTYQPSAAPCCWANELGDTVCAAEYFDYEGVHGHCALQEPVDSSHFEIVFHECAP